MPNEPTEPDSPSPLELEGRERNRLSKKKRTPFALAGVILLMMIACDPGEQEESNAPTVAEGSETAAPVSATDPFFLDLRTGEKTPLAENLSGGYAYVASPDGKRLVYGTNYSGCSGTGKTKVANIAGTHIRTLRSPKGLNFCAARWSPDGTKLVYQARNGRSERDVGNLFVHDLSSGRRTQLTHLELTNAWWWYLSPSFGPPGGYPFSNATGPDDVIFHLPRRSTATTKWDVWSVPMTGGEATLLVRNAVFPMLRAEGPEGLRVAFLSPSANDFAGRSIMTARPIPGSDVRQTRVKANREIWWPRMSPDGSRIVYQDGGHVYVVEIFTGETSEVAVGQTAEWLDDDTLILTPG
jgi:Tol biopolymer transport system component